MRKWLSAWLARRWLWWLGLFLWAALLFYLSSGTPRPPGPEFPMKDKVLHCVYFSGGAFCLVTALLAGRARVAALWVWLVAGLLFAGLTGALDEFHQSFTPGRSGNDPADWLADVCGGALGGGLARWVRHFLGSAQSEADSEVVAEA